MKKFIDWCMDIPRILTFKLELSISQSAFEKTTTLKLSKYSTVIMLVYEANKIFSKKKPKK